MNIFDAILELLRNTPNPEDQRAILQWITVEENLLACHDDLMLHGTFTVPISQIKQARCGVVGTPSVTALIRENATGVVREHQVTVDPLDTYIWEEGNYSCDCNRSIFFGGPEQEECSEGNFSVNLHRNDTGEIFYREYE